MVWPEVSIEDFPPQRDDEPASLRQDILDELTDHFACALNRELLKNPDEQLARQRVLNQFGDPIKIARQLWFDAMKEKIMSQRIMTGVSLIMAVCCIAVVGLAWVLVKESQVVNQSMLVQLAAIADRPQTDLKVVESLQHTNETIARELKNISERQQSGLPAGMGAFPEGSFTGTGSNSEEMNQVSFQLVQDKKGGKPAVNFTGKLTKSGNQTDTFTVEAVSNQLGKLDFGKLPWGKYELSLHAPWGEFNRQSDVTVIPGRNYSQTITCPTAPPAEVPVQFQVNWSKKLKSEDWFLLCDFRQTRSAGGEIFNYCFNISRKVGDDSWMTDQNELLKPRGVYLVDGDNQVSLCPLSRDGRFEDINLDSVLEKPTVNMIEGEYSLPVMYLIQNKDLKQLSLLNSSKSYVVIKKNRARTFSYNPLNSFQRAGSFGIFGGGFGGGSGGGFHDSPTTVILVPFKRNTPASDPVNFLDTIARDEDVDGIQLPESLTYSATKDQPNRWEIKLSDLGEIQSFKNPAAP